MARPAKYKATIDCVGQTFRGEGPSVYDALKNIDVNYIQIKNKGTVTVEAKGKKAEKFYYRPQLKKIVVNDLVKAWEAKQLNYLLENS